MLDQFLQLMAIVPVFIVGLVSLVILKYHGIDRTQTVSVHAARHPRTSFVLTLTILVTGTLYYLNIWLWIGTKYQLPFIDLVLLIALMGMLVLAFFPANKNRTLSAKLHQVAGILLVVLMFVVAALIALTPQLDAARAAGKIAALLFMIFALCLLLFYVFSKYAKKEAFILEVSYVCAFYVMIILATYY